MRLRFTIFTIRDLLWLTLAVALAVGWCFDRQRIISLAQQLCAVYQTPLDQLRVREIAH